MTSVQQQYYIIHLALSPLSVWCVLPSSMPPRTPDIQPLGVFFFHIQVHTQLRFKLIPMHG